MIRNLKYTVCLLLVLLSVTACGTKQNEEIDIIEASTENVAEEITPSSEPVIKASSEPTATPTSKESVKVAEEIKTKALEETVPDSPEQEAQQREEQAVKPLVEEAVPEQEQNLEEKNYCTISVRCDKVWDNTDKLSDELKKMLPADGIMLQTQQAEIAEGETVFDVLLRITKEKGLHFEFSKTLVYDSVYVEGIGNLYEFDCGELSGWLYRVNGEFVQKSCSETIIKDSDVIEWIYTCDMGIDVGKK